MTVIIENINLILLIRVNGESEKVKIHLMDNKDKRRIKISE